MRLRIVFSIFICGQLSAADLDFSLGFRNFAWGTPLFEIKVLYPAPFAEFTNGHRLIYVIEPRVGLVVDDDKLTGVICGQVLGSGPLKMLQTNGNAGPDVSDQAKFTDTLILSMSFADAIAALGLKPQKGRFIVKKQFGTHQCIAEFSRTDQDGMEEYKFYNLSVLPQARRPPDESSKPEPQATIDF